jgi:hypothetical protein
MQEVCHYQILRRNTNGTLRIEYLKTHVTDVDVPKDSNGNELRGVDLLHALNTLAISLDDGVFPGDDKDPTIDEELGLNVVRSAPEQFWTLSHTTST